MRSIATVLTLLLLNACAKNEMIISKADIFPTKGSLHAPFAKSADAFTNVNGVLKFQNAASFLKVLTELVIEDENWNENFAVNQLEVDYNDMLLMTNNELTELSRQATDIKRKAVFSEDQIFIDFEALHGFASLRSKIENETDSFLRQAHPEWDENPDHHFIMGQAERTLFNPDGAIMIGNSIYKVTEKGIVYEILHANFEALHQINNLDEDQIYNNSQVIVHQTTLPQNQNNYGIAAICEASKSSSFPPIPYNYGSNYFTGILANRNYIFFAEVVSSVRNYEWNGSVWQKANAFLQSQNWGMTSDTLIGGSCGPQKNHTSKLKMNFASRIISRYFTHLGEPKQIRTQSSWLHSIHIANASGHLFHLVW